MRLEIRMDGSGGPRCHNMFLHLTCVTFQPSRSPAAVEHQALRVGGNLYLRLLVKIPQRLVGGFADALRYLSIWMRPPPPFLLFHAQVLSDCV